LGWGFHGVSGTALWLDYDSKDSDWISRLPDPCLDWRPITRSFAELQAQPLPRLSGLKA